MFLSFQPHLYEQQRKLERQAATKSIKSPSSTTLLEAPSTSPSSSMLISSSNSSNNVDIKVPEMEGSPNKMSTPSPSLFSRRKERKRSATQSTSESPLNRKQSNTSLKPEKKVSRLKRPSSARPSSSGSALDENKGFNGRFFSIIPPLLGNMGPPAMIKEDVSSADSPVSVKSHQQKRDSSHSGTMHVSIPLNLSSDSAKKSPGSHMASSTGRLTALDGLGISHYLDSFPPPEEEHISSEELSHYPLPIRLGLLRPGQLPRSARKKLYRAGKPFPAIEPPIEPMKRKVTPQYCHGYYLCTPPPQNAASNDAKSMKSSNSQGPEGSSAERKESPHRPVVNGRDRSFSEAVQPVQRDMTRFGSGPSTATATTAVPAAPAPAVSSELTKRWKLEQYFRSYQTKTWNGIRSYKFHAYDQEEACYWLGYNPKTMMSEVLGHSIFCDTMGLSVLDWSKKKPTRVLDIGTGTGAWAVDAARQWPESELVGLDLVPCQTPLNHLSDDEEDMQSRVSWVVANALQGLPFPDNSFDYVHIRKINLGIPEDKWADILSESIRVLTPDGNLEILETDWTFMGSPKEILTSDLQELLSGKGRSSATKMKMWKHRDNRKYDNLGIAVNAMLKVRLVKFDPASLIPFHLTTLDDVGHISQSKPRHFPILARSSTYKPPKLDKKDDDEEDDDEEEEKKDAAERDNNESSPSKPWSPQGPSGDNAFTMRTQIGTPLPPHRFTVGNQDVLRMAMLVGDIIRVSEARDMIWDELQKGQKRVILTEEDKADIDEVKGPWKHRGEFDKDMDEWYADIIERADLETLLKSTFNWNEAASRMDNRIQIDRENRKETKKRARPTIPATSLEDSGSPVSAVTLLPDVRRLSEASDGYDEEDQSTIHGEHAPAPESFDLTTPILAFRTTTVFAAKKKPSS